MNIDYVTNPGDLHLQGGYGIAGNGITSSLNKLGHGVAFLPFMESASEVQFNFCFPSYFADFLSPEKYNIYMCVWESTKLQPDWYDILSEVDEVWAATPWCAAMLHNNGFRVDNIYSHGIGSEWKPKRRKTENQIVFLHEGEPTTRKHGQLAFDAFKAAFGDNQDVKLIIKSKGLPSIRRKNAYGSILGTAETPNTHIISETYEDPMQMVHLYHRSHCLVAPSAGEGFGLPGLQALATGIPTLVVKESAPYAKYLNGLGVEAEQIDSPWPDMHPGQVFQPNFDDLVDKYRYVYDNIDILLANFHKQSFSVHEEYDWLKLTEKAFEKIFKRFSAE